MMKTDNPYLILTIATHHIRFEAVKTNPHGGQQLEYSGSQPYGEKVGAPEFQLVHDYIVSLCNHWAGGRCNIEYDWEEVKPDPEILYVNSRGQVCPVCYSQSSLEGGPVEIDGGVAVQEVTCEVCGSSWNDLYELYGYSELVEGKKRTMYLYAQSLEDGSRTLVTSAPMPFSMSESTMQSTLMEASWDPRFEGMCVPAFFVKDDNDY